MNSTIKLTSLAAAALLPLASHAAEYATVISATPVTTSVNVPRRVCSDDRQFVQPQASGAGAVIGAIAGGLLGNAVGGHGGARAAATGVGAVAGAAVGNSVEMNGYPPTEVPVRRCQTVSGYENRTVGYDVVYEYAGQRYTTRMDHDPGREIAIDVRPTGAAQPDRRAPVYAESNPPVYEEAAPVYYRAAPAYYAPPPAYYIAPAIGVGIGLGYWGGHWGHRHWR